MKERVIELAFIDHHAPSTRHWRLCINRHVAARARRMSSSAFPPSSAYTGLKRLSLNSQLGKVPERKFMRIHDYGRELEIKVYDTVLMQCTGRKSVVIEEGWKSWRKYRLMALCTKVTSMQHPCALCRTNSHDLSDQQSLLHAPQWPHSRQYLLTDNTVVEFAPHRYPSHICVWFASIPL